MAVSGVPSGVVNIPDLVGYAENLRQVRKQEQDRLADYLGKFAKKEGLILDGAKQAVQGLYNDVEKAMVDVELNDNARSRAALNQAYAKYSEVAGAAQAYTQNVQKETAYALANPDKVNLKGKAGKDVYSEYNSAILNPEQIMSAATNPFLIDRKYSYKTMNPYELAQQVRKDWDETAKFSFIDPKTGKYDPIERDKWIRTTISTRLQDSEAQKNAALWSGLSLRQIGENGEVTDYNQVQNIYDNPNYDNWVTKFSDEAYKYAEALTPEAAVNPYEVRQDQIQNARQSQSQSGFGFGGNRKQGTHVPFERTVYVTNKQGKQNPVNLTGYQAQGGIYSGDNQIINFGTWPNGEIWVTYKGKDGSSSAVGSLTGTTSKGGGWGGKKANSQDIASIQQYLVDQNDRRTYDDIFAVSSNQPQQTAQPTVSAQSLREKYGYSLK